MHGAALDSHGRAALEVLYLGDWDPSGLHRSEVDIPSRIARYGGSLDLVRLALTARDTEGLPSFPAASKRRDARHAWFVATYGPRCWELGALSPVALRDRVRAAIVDRIEPEAWRRADVAEAAERESILSVCSRLRRRTISGQGRKYSEGRP